jgi:TrmH family RNA methyltransferase
MTARSNLATADRTSALALRHQKVQRLRRLISRRSAREAERVFVAEGAKLIEEALAANAQIEALYVAPEGRDLPVVVAAYERGARIFDLAPGVLERIAATTTPQPVVGVVGFVDISLAELAARAPTFVVVCAGVRDPGNLGTVLRSAEAAGAGAVVSCESSVDVYNPKTVRASAGSLFHVPVVTAGNAGDVLDQLGAAGLRRYATAAHGGTSVDDANLREPLAIVLGNEAHGLDDVALDGRIDGVLTIPMVGRGESLNVGMAAAVLAFEVARHRR